MAKPCELSGFNFVSNIAEFCEGFQSGNGYSVVKSEACHPSHDVILKRFHLLQ